MEWQLCIKNTEHNVTGEPISPWVRAHKDTELAVEREEEGGAAVGRDREDSRERTMAASLFLFPPAHSLSTCVNIHKGCSYIILP